MNIQQWDDIYKHKGPGSFLKYPNEILATQFFRHKTQINLNGKCLDYGFGSGNNAEFLIQYVKELYGIEISQSAIDNLETRLKHFDNYKKENFSLNFNSSFSEFDLIVAWQVLYYNTKSSFETTLDILYSLLKKDGIFIVSMSTHNDIKITCSKKIDENTFQIGNTFPHREGCIIYSPSSEQEFLHHFVKYNLEILDYGYFENMSVKTNQKLSEYYMVAKKI